MLSIQAAQYNTGFPQRSNIGAIPMGKPRTDPYNRLLSRFYEPLILLEVLGQVRGDHTPKRQDTSVQGIRRQFRDDLAFLCEYDKGGPACTAIGIEETRDCFVYWTASNDDASEEIVPFLESVLRELQTIVQIPKHDSQRENSKRQFTSRCILYASAKIKKQKQLVSRFAARCIQSLRALRDTSEYPGLIDWLQTFIDTKENLALSERAYESRKSHQMKQLDRLSRDAISHGQPGDSRRNSFSQVRHYIGRLADHIRVPIRLIEQLDDVEDLLTNRYEVRAIPVFECVPVPQADNLTTLDAICKRMLSARDPTLEEMCNKLADLDRNLNIHRRILDQYENEKFQPRVHAEVQVLEYFYNSKLRWTDGDRYVGCSKPACFCCQLYFRYHPSRPVEPDSHLRIWLNWGPPLLQHGAKDKMFTQQRSILNKMVADIREEALEQIRHKRQPHPWHPDSRTGITSSADSTTADAGVDDITNALRETSLEEASAQGPDEYDEIEDSSSETLTLTATTPEPDDGDNSSTSTEVEEDEDDDTDTDTDTDADGGARL